jgi:hypothetical protein
VARSQLQQAGPTAHHSGEHNPEAPSGVEGLPGAKLTALHLLAQARKRLPRKSRELGDPSQLVRSRRLMPHMLDRNGSEPSIRRLENLSALQP